MSPRFEHTAATVARARELRAGGWGPVAIARILSRELGRKVSHSQVSRWTSDVVHRRDVEGKRARRRGELTERRSGRLGQGHHTSEFQAHRARQLSRLPGMTPTLVARVMDFDYPDAGWTRHRVRRALR